MAFHKMSPEEVKRMNEYVEQYNAKLKRDKARRRIVKKILFTPIILILRLLKLAAELLKYPAAIAALYGLWCVYKVVVEVKGGSPFFRAAHLRDACIFVALPFVMCGLETLFLNLEITLECRKNR